MRSTRLIFAASGLIAAAVTAYAGSHAEEKAGFRQEDAHVHGEAVLSVAIDGQQLLIELESPAMNIVGFEHEPNNAQQEQAITTAKASLGEVEQLFVLPAGAGCVLASSEVEWSLEDDHDDHDDEHHESEAHDDEHHESEGHDDAHHDEHDEDETHSSFHAQYAFNCSSPSALDTIGMGLFEMFPATEEIEAQFVGPDGQGAQTLTADAAQLRL